MSQIIGIDLGTTHSLAAYLAEDGPRTIPNSLGESLTPSVVGVDDNGELLVGRAARELQVLTPEHCASLFKRRMGEADWSVPLGKRKFSAEELSSLVLSSLRQDAEAHFGEPVVRAVITVPAYFNDHQRKATINAGRMAGLRVERVLNEPTAAALAYGYHESAIEKLLLIFDLGGGTFDVSLVEIADRAIEVRSSSGESFLGGEDFTRALAARLLDRNGMSFERTELESPALVARLIHQCELAKRTLSRQEAATVRIPDRAGQYSDSSPEVTVQRSEFEGYTRHILSRVEGPIRRTLGDAGIRSADVDEVILVGGATRMPCVIDLVTRIFEKPPHRRLHPDEVVALGAAVQAGLIARKAAVDDLVVTDVCPFTLGIATSKRLGTDYREGYFLPIINRSTTIPISRVKTVCTLAANQTSVSVSVYQGEGRRVEQNLLLGEFEVRGIPRGPAGQEVDVRFTYDLNGVLEVEVTVLETSQKVTHVVAKHARGMSPEAVERAVRDMQALKTSPRDEAQNRFLIRRAERLHTELPLGERTILSQLLDGFEDALELNDPEAILRNRDALLEFLDRFDDGGDGAVEPDNDWYRD